jgi:hypothetical protein
MTDERPIYCDDGCGELAEVTIEDTSHADGYRGDVNLCRACLEKRMAHVRE